MGCESGKVIQINMIKKDNINSTSNKMQIDLNSHYGGDKYKDFPEWEGDRYRGIGIKRMKGYKCSYPIDELNKLREEFWLNKRRYNKVWKVIRQICIMDEYRANSYLQQFKMTTANGCINHLIDDKGNHYHIPNYCINDPFFEKELATIDDQTDEKVLDIVVYELTENKNVPMRVTNLTKGRDIKVLYINEGELSFSIDNLRLFFGGSEIKDEHILAQYNIDNGYKIIAIKIK